MHILVVEDNELIRTTLVRALSWAEYVVTEAEDGLEALVQLRGSRPCPQLILLDLMMPQLDGFGFRQAQLADPELAHIPVIILSAHNDLDLHAAPLNSAAVISKPFDVNQLLIIVARVLQQAATTQTSS